MKYISYMLEKEKEKEDYSKEKAKEIEKYLKNKFTNLDLSFVDCSGYGDIPSCSVSTKHFSIKIDWNLNGKVFMSDSELFIKDVDLFVEQNSLAKQLIDCLIEEF